MEFLPVPITRFSGQACFDKEDVVAVEARYTVKCDRFPAFSFTCTPSHLEEMVTGALYSRKHIQSFGQIDSITIEGDTVFVTLGDAAPAAADSVGAVDLEPQQIFRVVDTLFTDPDTLFNRTGCAHSCALLRQGRILCTMEDIGRHNALDKVIGYALKNGIPISKSVIFSSGRISQDYLEKVIKAGFKIVVSRAAVTASAVALAREKNITMLGFIRRNGGNIYHVGEVAIF